MCVMWGENCLFISFLSGFINHPITTCGLTHHSPLICHSTTVKIKFLHMFGAAICSLFYCIALTMNSYVKLYYFVALQLILVSVGQISSFDPLQKHIWAFLCSVYVPIYFKFCEEQFWNLYWNSFRLADQFGENG